MKMSLSAFAVSILLSSQVLYAKQAYHVIQKASFHCYGPVVTHFGKIESGQLRLTLDQHEVVHMTEVAVSLRRFGNTYGSYLKLEPKGRTLRSETIAGITIVAKVTDSQWNLRPTSETTIPVARVSSKGQREDFLLNCLKL